MRKIFRNSLLALFLLCMTSCSTTYYYVVRHGEKERQTDDTPLSEAGWRRADALAARLADTKIKRIFVSDRLRTLQTAGPTARLLDAECIVVPKVEVDRLVTDLKDISGESVLVVWHSEELPLIVNSLSPNDTIDPIGDDYDNLFIIKKEVFFGQKSFQLQRLTYGEPSEP